MLLPPAELGRSSWHPTHGNHHATSEGSCRFKTHPWRHMSVGQRHQKTQRIPRGATEEPWGAEQGLGTGVIRQILGWFGAFKVQVVG